MNNQKFFPKADRAGFVLGAVLLGTLAGCAGSADGPRTRTVYSAPPPGQTVIMVQDDYVYYPGYYVYYNSNRRQYAYLEGGVWVSRPAPPGVSINVLMASPSVRMDFHDSPAHHNAVVVQKYPKNWAPPGSNHGQKENHKDGRHDERGENNEK